MATELGKAYVQIIPSAQGISGKISSLLKGESAAAGTTSGTTVGSKLVSTAKKVIAVAGIGKAISASVTEGGKLQQSIGGVETLFKDSAGRVRQYAAEAYRTSGVSANEYMQNVTKFSAALLQATSGNTRKSADVANMAMKDMADNANKMGTSMLDIQNAYQGFAKQNYTMLDNLRLGYGGTKSEMERLLADATKLTGVKYDINNLADVYNAIHAIQGELGITGTTAQEAMMTLTGSFGMMKASFQDALGSLAIGEGVQQSFANLANTVKTFVFDNLIPMVGEIFKNIPTGIASFAQTMGPLLMDEGKKLMDSLSQGFQGNQALQMAFQGIRQHASEFATGLGEVFQQIPQTFHGVVQAFGPLGQAIMSGLSQIDLSGFISTLKTGLGQIPGFFQGIVSAITPVVSSIMSALSQLDFSGVQAIASAVLPALSAGFQAFMGVAGPAITQVAGSFKNLWNAIQPVLQTLAGALMPILQVVGSFLGGVFKGFLMGVSAAFDLLAFAVRALTPVFNVLVAAFKLCAPAIQKIAAVVGTVIGMFANFGSAGNSLKSIMSSAWNNIKAAVQAAKAGIGAAITGIKGFFTGLKSSGTTLKSALQAAWNGIKAAVATAKGGIQTAINTIKNVFTNLKSSGDTLKAGLTAIWNGIKAAITAVVNALKTVITGGFNAMKSVITSASNGIKAAINTVKSVFNSLKSAGNSLKAGLQAAWNAIKSAVSAGVSAISGHINRLKGIFNSLRNINLSSAGRAIMNGFLRGILAVWNTIKSKVSSMAGWIRAHKGPISYDKKLLIPAGRAIMGGLNKGLLDHFEDVQKTTLSIAGFVSDQFNSDVLKMQKLRYSVSGESAFSPSGFQGQDCPLEVHLTLGGTEFKAFVDSISKQQQDAIHMALAY